MKKKVIVLTTTIMLGIGSYLSVPSAGAETNPVTQAEVDRATVAVNKVQSEIAALNSRIKQVDQAVKDNQNMIENTEKDIAKTQGTVKDLEKEIVILEKQMQKRNDILKQRAVTYQKTNGNSNYLEILLGASSFGDFIERAGAVNTIVKADKELIKQTEDDQTKLEDKQSSVKKKLTSLKDMKTELVGMQEDIKMQQKHNEELKQELKAKEADSKRQLEEAKAKNIEIVIEKPVEKKAEPVVKAVAAAKEESNKEESYQDNNEEPKQNVSSEPSTPSKPNSPSKPSVSSKPNTNAGFTSPSTSTSKSIQKVITAGNRYIGNSVYVFGGGRTESDIRNGRFDCSGFVSWAFRQGGYSVPASTDALKYAGRQIKYSQIQPGDMVFFDTYKKDGHVGIYVGGGKFIGSQSSTGVAIASMTSGYWKGVFNGRVVRVW